MEFVALDVETANADCSSICQIGIARFDDGCLAEEWSTLVNPEDDFDPFNVSIHGITADMVEDSPVFPNLAENVRGRLKSRVVVCHTPFDRVAISRACSGTSWKDSNAHGLIRPVSHEEPGPSLRGAVTGFTTCAHPSATNSDTMTPLKMRRQRQGFCWPP